MVYNKVKKGKYYFILLLLITVSGDLFAQNQNCFFKDTLLTIDFGTLKTPQEFNLRSLKNYTRSFGSCPDDGYFSFSTETNNCFKGDWITLYEDHTPNDKDGKMFLVNASTKASVFFISTLGGFKPNTTYELALWMMNLCRINGPCTPLPPDIFITLETKTGKKIISFQTGLVVSVANPNWKRYHSLFTTPDDGDFLIMKMEDRTNGGCGNDFVIDDITFRECYKPIDLTINKENKPVPEKANKPAPVLSQKEIQETKPDPVLNKKNNIVIEKSPVEDISKRQQGKVTTPNLKAISLPDVIMTRENPVIKKIETTAAEMLIELYDNGQIDGDTVSIYHNNELIISHAGLSEKPVRFKINVDAKNPHHELIMVADNLGSIPPNTSLMIITAKGKRFEIFISSSDQKNAKLLIDLKE